MNAPKGRPVHLANSNEPVKTVEQLLENLITIVGRNNRNQDELLNRVRQLEQFIHETAPAKSANLAESHSFMTRVK
jgi:hypothetical protein